MRCKILIFCFLIYSVFIHSWTALAKEGDFIVLCFHDIPAEIKEDAFAVDRETFVNTIEYLRAHDFHFVSFDDVLAAHEGRSTLPTKPILLTFDDAYRSFYDFVFPVLRQYKIPSVLAVVDGWIDEPPETVKQPLMTWPQVKKVADSGLVEIASHSHQMHKGIVYNPQGNEAAAAASRYYDSQRKSYEDEETYRRRVGDDLQQSKTILEKRSGLKVRSIVWPYGQYSQIALEEAQKAGLSTSFSLNDRMAHIDNVEVIERYLVYKNPPLTDLLTTLGILPGFMEQKRMVQADLDYIYDEDPEQTEKNLSQFLERIKNLKVTTVLLQAFADPDGNGNIREVYFPNRVLPMRADLFNRVAHQLKTRVEVEVYAWMPMLSIVPPDEKKREEWRVREFKDKGIQLSTSWYERLSPFSPPARELLNNLYEDLAINARMDGVIFQDDGYLNDFEDFQSDALARYKEITGGVVKAPSELTSEEKKQWTQLKVDQLFELTQELMTTVRRHRPEAKFARTLYAPSVLEPKSAEWFAQDYGRSLQVYDYAVIMSYPYMEDIRNHQAWLAQLVKAAKTYPDGIPKTVFKIQAFDWKKKRWIEASRMNEWLRTLVAAGARHLAYYPDNYLENKPDLKTIRLMMSIEDFPFERK